MKGRSFPFKGIIAYPPRCQGPIYKFLVFAFFSSVRAEGARVYFEFYALFYAYLFFRCFRPSHGAKRPEGSKKAPAWQALCDGFVENAGVCIIFVKMNFEKFPVRTFPPRGKVACRAGWGDFRYGRAGGVPGGPLAARDPQRRSRTGQGVAGRFTPDCPSGS